MMLAKTQVAPSGIHGMGLFAVEFIPRGTPIWRFQPGFDQEFTPEQFDRLPPEAQAHLHWFAFFSRENGRAILSGDHACFMNHASQPNTGALPEAALAITTVALREIAAGEEITCDYYAFDAKAAAKLGS
ncbi:MAG: SET domain-containing protein [Verrucomicrobiota bacterium]